MNLILLVWSYLKAKPLNTILNVFLLAMGIAMMTTLMLVSKQLDQKISENTKGIDLVVGAKGSPLQIILCNIFHVDFPTGNIKLRDAERLARNRLVKKAIPLALGDSYQTFRIVGTDTAYTSLYHGTLAKGAWWVKDMEVVTGARVAEELHLTVGSTFSSSHGLTAGGHGHHENPYHVTGILKKSDTVLDNLIFTNIGSIWKVHEPVDTADGRQPLARNPSPLVSSAEAGDTLREITSLLIRYRNPIAAIQLPRSINSQTNMQAASPAFETARLFSILGVGVEVMMGFASALVVISGLSIFIALYNSLKERQYDLAIMRSMGASRSKLFVSIMIEGSFLTVAGSILGVLIGHLVIFLFTVFVEESQRTGISAFLFYRVEIYLVVASFMLGLLCSFIPAWQAYRTDIHKILAGN